MLLYKNRINQNNIKKELFKIRRENGRFLIQYYRSTIDSVIKIFNGLKKKKNNMIKKIKVKDIRRELEDGTRTLKVF